MKNLFEAVELNNLRVKNRLVRSATWEGIAEYDGSIGDDTYEIYRELAKGGVGTIITGFTSVATNDFYFGGMMRLSDNKLIPQYKKLVEIIHAEDCAAISQLAMGAFYDKNFAEVPENNLSAEAVREIIKMFVDAAVRAELCGFDGVQIHAAHFFFLSRFISPLINHRTDEFGGSTAARAKILLEILRGIKAGVNEGYFADFAARFANVVSVPIICVGGWRSRQEMFERQNAARNCFKRRFVSR